MSRHCEAATYFEKNLAPVLTKQLFSPSSVKTCGRFFSNFVAFSENMNFPVFLNISGTITFSTEFPKKNRLLKCFSVYGELNYSYLCTNQKLWCWSRQQLWTQSELPMVGGWWTWKSTQIDLHHIQYWTRSKWHPWLVIDRFFMHWQTV